MNIEKGIDFSGYLSTFPITFFQMLIDLRMQKSRNLFCVLGTLFLLTDKNLNSLWTIRDKGRHDDFWDANRTPSKPEFKSSFIFNFDNQVWKIFCMFWFLQT